MDAQTKSTPIALGSPKSNDILRAGLHHCADHGAAPRPVLHYAYPLHGTGQKTREKVMRELELRGFGVSPASLRGGLVLSHTASVTASDFDATTAGIVELLREHRWEYDGWETLPPVDVSLIYWRQLEAAPVL